MGVNAVFTPRTIMNAVSTLSRPQAEYTHKLVVWVFRDGDGDWSLRREGDVNERHFQCRQDAVDFAHCLAAASSGYKLFLQLPSGRFVTEYRGFYR